MLKIVDLYADWCMPCRAQKPILEEVEKLYSSDVLEIERIDVDKSQQHAEFFEVKSIPTMIFMKDDIIVDRVVGLVPKDQLIEKINSFL